jgi:DeoR/GlpR family transcriptional regulator of sugar metabolism
MILALLHAEPAHHVTHMCNEQAAAALLCDRQRTTLIEAGFTLTKNQTAACNSNVSGQLQSPAVHGALFVGRAGLINTWASGKLP